MDSIFESIKDAFSALWTFRKRGDSYEIITPFATIAGMYVSVFLTHRESGHVVTDGGWLDKGVYGALPHCAAKTADRMFVRLGNPCGVERTTSPDGLEYFYKIMDDRSLIPNAIMDVANFVSALTVFSATSTSEK